VRERVCRAAQREAATRKDAGGRVVRVHAKVDPVSFKVLCTILAEGDIAKAGRSLDLPEETVRAAVRRWQGKGKEYRAMLELVRWRKKVGGKGRSR